MLRFSISGLMVIWLWESEIQWLPGDSADRTFSSESRPLILI
jgi:hypothetical protein